MAAAAASAVTRTDGPAAESARRLYTGSLTPALVRLAAVAEALGALRADVVFIGGAIAPLIHPEIVLPRIRPTKDIDGVIASSSYTRFHAVEEQLRALGFRQTGQAPDHRGHAHRWVAPDGTPFDLVPAGDHLGASGNPIDNYAVATAETLELHPGLIIRHASACAFLGMTWGAYRDRGEMNPLESHDLEDIIALVASRPTIVDEVLGAPGHVRTLIAQHVREFLELDDVEEVLVAHTGFHTLGAEQIAREVRARVEAMRSS